MSDNSNVVPKHAQVKKFYKSWYLAKIGCTVALGILLFCFVTGYNGGESAYSQNYTASCGTCKGSGACPFCRGRGHQDGQDCGSCVRGYCPSCSEFRKYCGSCEGTGRCFYCSGVGYVGGSGQAITCPACRRAGTCIDCRGSGLKRRSSF